MSKDRREQKLKALAELLPVQVAAAKRGDKVALQLLQEACLDRLLKFAFFLLRDFAVAQELSGEVLASALKNIQKVEVAEKLPWWLLRLLKTKYDEHKEEMEAKSVRRKESSLVWQKDGALPIDAAELSIEFSRDTQKLSFPDRWLLLMWGLEEMSVEALSEVSGLSASAVQRRLQEALSDLADGKYQDQNGEVWKRFRDLEIQAPSALRAWVTDAVSTKSLASSTVEKDLVSPIRDKTLIDQDAPIEIKQSRQKLSRRKIFLASAFVFSIVVCIVIFIQMRPSSSDLEDLKLSSQKQGESSPRLSAPQVNVGQSPEEKPEQSPSATEKQTTKQSPAQSSVRSTVQQSADRKSIAKKDAAKQNTKKKSSSLTPKKTSKKTTSKTPAKSTKTKKAKSESKSSSKSSKGE